jgi:hypothetical protein
MGSGGCSSISLQRSLIFGCEGGIVRVERRGTKILLGPNSHTCLKQIIAVEVGLSVGNIMEINLVPWRRYP